MKEEFIIPNAETVLSLALTSNSFLCGCDKGQIACVDLRSTQTNFINSDGVNDVSTLCLDQNRSHVIYAGIGEKVLTYDLRNSSEPVRTYHENVDEINKLSLNAYGRDLAAADDKGDIVIFNLDTHSVLRRCTGRHSNICSSAMFHPERKWQMFSCGLDCNVIQWDYARGKMMNIAFLQDLLDNSLELPVLTWPLAYSIDISPDGKFLVCGAQDGAIYIFLLHQRHLEFYGSMQAHLHGISGVQFSSGANDRPVLISAANDGKIAFWDMEKLEACNGTEKPFRMLNLSQQDFLRAMLTHNQKINDFIACRNPVHHRDSLFVADVTNMVTCYTMV